MPNFNKDLLREGVARAHATDTLPLTKPSNDETPINTITTPSIESKGEPARKPSILDRCSLFGQAAELEQAMEAQRPFLGEVALSNQATLWYAAPNTGKTLLAIHMIMEAVQSGGIDPTKVYYLAADDNANGLVEKLHLLEEFKVQVIAPGYNGFETALFASIITKMTNDNEVNGVFIIADTVKKFVSLMDKNESRKFGDVIRRFVLKGGTFVGLAHTNKNRGSDGNLVYSGTTDMLEDVDCAYTIDTMESEDPDKKAVAFKNIKRRGNVAERVAYSYSVEPAMSFDVLLSSVCKIGDEELNHMERAADVRSDAAVISAIELAISEGVNSKMALAKLVLGREKVSRKRVVTTLEKYTGDDPDLHRWQFSVIDHGKRVYVPLELGDKTGL